MLWCKWLAGLTLRAGDGDAGRQRRRRRERGTRLLLEELETRALFSANPVYTAVTGAANPANGIDVGTYSVPKLADLDGDGDLDLVVGETSGQLFYFQNTGTTASPVFVQRTGAANPFNGIDVGSYSAPAFGDLDGDGDLDLLSGTQPGTFLYFENTGTTASPTFVQRTGSSNPSNGLDVGNFSIPELGDIDGDGDLDMASGDTVGKVHYFRNTGTTASPAFAEQTGASNPFNGIDVGAAGSTPALGDVDGDGDLDLVSGESSGVQFYFENTGTTGSPVFVARTGTNNPFNGLDVGSFSAPAFGDLDGDGDLDLLSGNSIGSLNYFQASPGLASSTTTLNLGTATTGTAGTTQTFTVSGTALVADLALTAPAGVELSKDSGTTWQTSLTLTPSGGVVSVTTISARISAGASVGSISGNVSVTSTGAATQNVAVSGTVNAVPSVTASTASLALGTTTTGTAGTTQTFTVSGTALVADITLTAPAGVELSKDGGSTWQTTLTLTPSSGVVSVTTISARISAGASVGGITGNVSVTSTGAATQDLAVSGTVNQVPSVTSSETSLSLGTTTTGTAGATQTFTVSGADLIADLAVTAPAGVELSKDSGATWQTSLTLAPSGGVVSVTTISARISAGAAVGSISGTISVTSTGAATQNVAVSGTVNAVPSVTASTASLALGTTTTGTAGATQTFTVSGTALVADLALTAPAGVELSKDGGSTWQTTLTLTPSGGVVSVTTISARISAGASVGSISGNVSVTSTGAATQNVAVSGTVNAVPSVTASTASLALGTTTTGTAGTTQTFTVSGTALVADLAVTAPAGVELSKDSGTTWQTSLTLTPSGGVVSVTTISARISAGASVGSISGNVSVTSTGAATQNVAVGGTVNAIPSVTSSDTSLSLGTTTPGTAGATQTFIVSGTALIADLTVTAPTGVELSSDGGSTWQTTLTLAPSGGVVSVTTISARISAGAAVGPVGGNISVTSTGAATQDVAVSGLAVNDPTEPGVELHVADLQQTVGETSPQAALATFSFGDGSASPGAFGARIVWGDGTESDAAVEADGAGYRVLAAHAYGQPGLFTFRVIVTTPGGADFQAAGTADAGWRVLPTGQPAEAPDRFILSLYTNLLGRSVTAEEFQQGYFGEWVARLNKRNEAGTPVFTREQIVEQFLVQDETLHVRLNDLYQQYLGRDCDDVGFQVFGDWLRGGASEDDVAAALAGSAEYATRQGVDPLDVIRAAYRDALGREADDYGLSYWGGLLGAGASVTQVLDGIFSSAEYGQRVVDGFYSSFLGRLTDPAGGSVWGSVLSSGGTPADVIAGILGDNRLDEYYNRATR